MIIRAQNSFLIIIDIQERLAPKISNQACLLKNTKTILQAARHFHIPVMATEHYAKGIGQTLPEIRSHLQQDEILEKITFSLLREEPIRQRLVRYSKEHKTSAEQGIDFILVGAEAHICVLQSAMDLLAASQGKDAPLFPKGSRVILVRDAIGSRCEDSKQAALERFAQLGGQNLTTEMLLFEWLERAGTDDFRALLPLIK